MYIYIYVYLYLFVCVYACVIIQKHVEGLVLLFAVWVWVSSALVSEIFTFAADVTAGHCIYIWAVFKTPVHWWLVGELYHPLYIEGYNNQIAESRS